MARVKRANPAATYTCDPVMGNAKSGCFVNPAIPILLRDRVVPAADLITPNQFELGFLTDTAPRSLEETLASVDLARAMGPRSVLVTSVEQPDAPADTIEMLAVTDAGAWLVQTPKLPLKANGSGDLTSALFTAHLHTTGDPAQALSDTAASVLGVLQTTIDSGERELQIVLGQDAIANPSREFTARKVR